MLERMQDVSAVIICREEDVIESRCARSMIKDESFPAMCPATAWYVVLIDFHQGYILTRGGTTGIGESTTSKGCRGSHMPSSWQHSLRPRLDPTPFTGSCVCQVSSTSPRLGSNWHATSSRTEFEYQWLYQ
jgi:hypothetical protein